MQERNLTVQHSATDGGAFVVFCLAAYVLQVAADDCWSTPRKMMSQYVFYSEVCAILAKETSDPFTNMAVRSTDRSTDRQLYQLQLQAHRYEIQRLHHVAVL